MPSLNMEAEVDALQSGLNRNATQNGFGVTAIVDDLSRPRPPGDQFHLWELTQRERWHHG